MTPLLVGWLGSLKAGLLTGGMPCWTVGCRCARWRTVKITKPTITAPMTAPPMMNPRLLPVSSSPLLDCGGVPIDDGSEVVGDGIGAGGERALPCIVDT